MSRKRKPLCEYYKIDNITGCWNFIGTQRGGYGMISNPDWSRNNPVGAKMIDAHRYFWGVLKFKLAPEDVLHHICRNRLCVNPDHLEIVTHKENIRAGAVPKIDLAVAQEIKYKYSQGAKQIDLALEYKISQPTVSQIVRGVTWS